MVIYHDERGNTLTREYKGPRQGCYRMTIHGWHGGGFSAKSDTEALRIFRGILRREEAAAAEADS